MQIKKSYLTKVFTRLFFCVSLFGIGNFSLSSCVFYEDVPNYKLHLYDGDKELEIINDALNNLEVNRTYSLRTSISKEFRGEVTYFSINRVQVFDSSGIYFHLSIDDYKVITFGAQKEGSVTIKYSYGDDMLGTLFLNFVSKNG